MSLERTTDPITFNHKTILKSTIGHGVPSVALLGIAIPFIVFFLFKVGTYSKKGGWLLCLFLFLAAMVSTLSRGTWIATFIASMIVVGFRLKDSYAFGPAILHKNSPSPSLIEGGEERIEGSIWIRWP
jgi:hypothetical protein